MITSKIKIRNQFADETTRDLEFGPLGDVNSETLRTAVKTFDVAAIADKYLSDDGASFTKIAEASISIVEENEINLN